MTSKVFGSGRILVQPVTQRWTIMPGPPGGGGCGRHRVEHGFLRRLGGGAEESVDAVLVEGAQRYEIARLIVVDRIGGGEGDGDVAAAIAPEGAEPGEAGSTAPCNSLKLSRFQRHVGRDDQDHRATLGLQFHLRRNWA